MRLQNLRVVFLDIDNTLYDYEGSMRLHVEQVRCAFDAFAAIDPDAFHRAYWDGYAAVPEEEKLRLLRADVRAYRRRVWAEALACAGCPSPGPEEVEALFSRLRDDELPPHPGAVDLVRELAERVRVGVISNGPGDLQRRKLRALGVEPHVEKGLVFISHEVGHDKPDARIFRRALQAAREDPGACLMIGDDPVRDGAAKAHGMRVVLLRSKPPGAAVRYPGPALGDVEAIPPDATVANFEELRRLLQR